MSSSSSVIASTPPWCTTALYSAQQNRVRYMPRAHGSQSSDTSIDSDIEEDVGSDVDNSRVLAPHEIKSQIPESSTPRKTNAQGDSQSYPPDSLHTQATQQVNPLTPSQLRALMGEDEDEDADETRDEIVNGSIIPEGNSEHILSTSEGEEDDRGYGEGTYRTHYRQEVHSRGSSATHGAHGAHGAHDAHGGSSRASGSQHKNTPMSANMAFSLIEGVASRTSSRREDQYPVRPLKGPQDDLEAHSGVPPEASLEAHQANAHQKVQGAVLPMDRDQLARNDHTMHAVAALQHMHNNEPINSSPENWVPPPQHSSGSGESRNSLRGRRGFSGGSAEVIEETPMKLLSMPATTQSPFVFILVKWTGSPHWWPARCSRADWQERKPKTRVLFRKNEFGYVDLRQNPVVYQLQPDDMVHVITKPAKQRFIVVACGVTTLPEGSIWTNDGFNQIRIQNANNREDEFSVDAEDIYLTKSDMQLWRTRQESTSGVNAGDITLGGLTPGGRGSPQNFTTPTHINDAIRHGLDTPGSSHHNTTHNTTVNATIASANSKPPSVSVNLHGDMSAGGALGGREPLDTPTNNGTKRRSAGRSDNANLTYSNSPRKRRVRSVDYGDDNSSDESSSASSPSDPNEDYNLKSSPIVSPVRRSRTRHSRHFKEPIEQPSWKEASNVEETSINGRFNKLLFKNCIFSISTHETQSVKLRARDILVAHGAKVLDEGLSELVSLTDISEEDSGSVPDHECDFGNATFAAVLADQPRRTSKYLEMVALGWPCLSITYMHDCVEQNKMLDWRPYLLPAGKSNLIGKKMSVSLDTSAFYQKWIRDMPLNQQFNTRKVVFRCSVPLCIVTNHDTLKSSLVLLASFCAPRFKLWFYSSKRDVPEGGILLDLKPTTNTSKEIKRTEPGLLEQLQNYAAADSTVVKNTEWMIQCIINGGLV